MAPGGTTFIPNLKKFSPDVLELKHADRETDGQTDMLFTSCKVRITVPDLQSLH